MFVLFLWSQEVNKSNIYSLFEFAGQKSQHELWYRWVSALSFSYSMNLKYVCGTERSFQFVYLISANENSSKRTAISHSCSKRSVLCFSSTSLQFLDLHIVSSPSQRDMKATHQYVITHTWDERERHNYHWGKNK